MSDFIPQELLTLILIRVPPKSLIRFRCVCKSWKSLISTPDFVAMHTQHAFLSETPMPRILVRHFSEIQNAEIYSVHHDNEAFTVDDDIKIVLPFRCSFDYFRIVGSCNGLFLISGDFLGSNEMMFLWNPLLRRKITLPSPRANFENIGPFYSVLGFGYDTRRNDFKVVRLTYVQGNVGEDLLPPIVEVFSLSTGNWREINDNPLQNWVTGLPRKNTFVNGKVHWIGMSAGMERRSLIQVFDISEEVFEEIPFPDDLDRKQCRSMVTTVYEKSLAVLHSNKKKYPNIRCCIWVMEEYGVGKSWTKMFNIQSHVVLHSKMKENDPYIQFCIWLKEECGVGKCWTEMFNARTKRFLGFRKNGDILLTIKNGELVSYDPRTRGATGFGINCTSDDEFGDLYVDTYTESLALVNEGEQVLLAQLPNETEPLLTRSAR